MATVEKLPNLHAVLERIACLQAAGQFVNAERDSDGIWTLVVGYSPRGPHQKIRGMSWTDVVALCAYAESNGHLDSIDQICGPTYRIGLEITSWGEPFGKALISSQQSFDDFINQWFTFWHHENPGLVLHAQ